MTFEKGDIVVLRDKHSEFDGETGYISQVVETMFGDTNYTIRFDSGQENGVPKDKLEVPDNKKSSTQIYQQCSHCRASLSEYDDPPFCPECGIERASKSDCVSCGTDLPQYDDIDLNFCPECGTDLTADRNTKVYDS